MCMKAATNLLSGVESLLKWDKENLILHKSTVSQFTVTKNKNTFGRKALLGMETSSIN